MNSLRFLWHCLSLPDPLGNVGIFLSLTDGDSSAVRRSQAFKGNLYALILLLVFLFGGPFILHFLGITLDSVNLGGGLVVGAVGWSLIQSKETRKSQGDQADNEARVSEDIAFCPLALPLIAGPGAIAVVIAAGRQAMDEGLTYWIAATLGTIVAMLISWICLRQARTRVESAWPKRHECRYSNSCFLLVCIAAQMIITGPKAPLDGMLRRRPHKELWL